MTNEELIHSFETDTLPADSFHHADHVRLAFAYLSKYPVLQALDKFATALKRFAAARGKSGLYNETITHSYFFLIRERIARDPKPTWEEFAGCNPDLLVWKGGILARYYRESTLQSELARWYSYFPTRAFKPMPIVAWGRFDLAEIEFARISSYNPLPEGYMKSAKELVAQANSRVKTVAAQDAMPLVNDADTVFVDLRDSSELQRDGKIPGAVHVNRGMLEFTLDPTLSYHNPVFSSGKNIVFYCASGGRSALAADTAQSMGLSQVSHLGGGFKGWKDANGPVEKA